MDRKVTARITSIGTDSGKAVVRVDIEKDGLSGFRIVTIPTSIAAFAELAAAGIPVINNR